MMDNNLFQKFVPYTAKNNNINKVDYQNYEKEIKKTQIKNNIFEQKLDSSLKR